jgi:hypothetical protein
MEPRDPREIYTLRHFLFYMGAAALAGAVIGLLANLMDWSNGVVYGVGLPTGFAVVVFALRETLFEPARKPNGHRHRRHT